MTDIKKCYMKRGREPAGWPHIREGTGARPQEPGKGYFCGGFLYTARPSPACRRAMHPAAPGERDELWEELLTTESTKKAQRTATSYELRATSREKKATGGQENLFVNLCETSVSSVVKKEINTEIFSTKHPQRKPAACSLKLEAN